MSTPPTFVLLLLSFLSIFAFAGNNAKTHWVLDVDRVLFRRVSTQEAAEKHIQGITYGDNVFYPVEGADKFLSSLASVPNSDITFDSAGDTDRVNYLLSHFLVENATGERVPAKDLAVKVLTGEDTTDLKSMSSEKASSLRPELAPFSSGSVKKDLTNAVPAEELHNTVLFDDRTANVVKGQEKSLLWVMPLGHDKSADTTLQNSLDKYQLLRVRATIQRALETAEKSGKSITDVLFQMQWDKLPDHYEYKVGNYLDLSLYEEGAKLLGIQSRQVDDLSHWRLPPLSSSLVTDDQKLANLLFVRLFIPTLFQQGAKFGFSPLTIVDGEQQLLTNLERDPSYRRSLLTKRDYEEFTVKDSAAKPKIIKGYSMDSAQAESFKKSTAALYAEIAEASDPRAEILSRMKTEVEKLKKGEELNASSYSSLDVTSALIKLLPKEQQSEAFRAPDIEAKLQFLEKIKGDAIPEEISRANRWPAGFKMSDAIQEVQKIKNREDDLGRLSIAWSLIENDGSVAEMKRTLLAPTSDQLNTALDPELIRERVNTLVEEAEKRGIKLHYQAHPKAFNESQLRWATGAVAGQSSVFERDLSKSITLIFKEMPPEVLDFRGCPAGNCSTGKQFPIPHDPNERGFYIYREGSNDPIGALEGTLVFTEGELPTFYVNTLQGPKMSDKEVSLALRALPGIVKKYGTSEILFPDPKKFLLMFNNQNIASIVESYLDTSHLVPITFKNPRVRSEIEDFTHTNNTTQYDNMSENGFGARFIAPKDDKTLQIESRPLKFPEVPELDRVQSVGIALDLQFSRRFREIQRLAKGLSVNLKELQPLFDVVGNAAKLPATEYVQAVHKYLHSVDLPDTILDDRQSLLRRGWLQAPDALSPENFSKTADYFAKEITAKVMEPDVVAFSREHWHELISDPKVQKAVLSQLKGTNDDLDNLVAVMPSGAGALPESMTDVALSRISEPFVKNTALGILPYLSTDPRRPDEFAEVLVHELRGLDKGMAGAAGAILFKFEPRTPYVESEIVRAASDPRITLGARQTLIGKLAQTSPQDAKTAILATFKHADNASERQLFALSSGTVVDPEISALARQAYLREDPVEGVKIKRILLQSMMAQLEVDPLVKPLLLQAATDPDVSIRKQFITTAIQKAAKAPEWFDAVYPLASDPDPSVRQAVANELGNRAPNVEKAQEVLLQLSMDENLNVRDVARAKLTQLTLAPTINPERRALLKSSLREILENGHIGPDPCVLKAIERDLSP